jgi:DNA-binding SARP family transcriptional activator
VVSSCGIPNGGAARLRGTCRELYGGRGHERACGALSETLRRRGVGGSRRWPWRRHPTGCPEGYSRAEWVARSADVDARTDRQQPLAIQVLGELVELSPAELAAALAYVRQLRVSPMIAHSHPAPVGPPTRLREEAHLPDNVKTASLDRVGSRAHRFLERCVPGASPPDRADVLVRALGPLEVVVSGTPVRSWGGSRVRTLFEYLLLHRRPVHREVLMELLWPGYPHRSARNNLNVSMYGLRRALDQDGGREYVVHRDAHYALNLDLAWSFDYARFVHAAEESQLALARGQPDTALVQAQLAVDEYRGVLFEDDPNANWCEPERAALADMFAQTLELQGDLYLGHGDTAAAQRAAQRLVDEDSCRESAHRLLMACHARRGQRDQIVRQYRRCVTILQDELDITPSTETVRLFRQLTGRR